MHEGQELALGCLARTSTQKHTHLAVSFGRAVPEAPVGRATLQEVVGLRPDLAVDAGAPYAARLAAGELRLDKEGSERYRMVLGGAQADDAGTYHCTAAEWIQDPDGSWAQIAEKRAVLAHVDVQTLGECPGSPSASWEPEYLRDTRGPWSETWEPPFPPVSSLVSIASP